MFDNNQPLVMKANVNTIQHPHLMDPDRSIEGGKTQVSRRQARLVWQKATDLANKIEAEGIERDGIYEAAIAVGYTPEEAELVVQNVASDANWEFIKHETGVISVRSDDKCTPLVNHSLYTYFRYLSRPASGRASDTLQDLHDSVKNETRPFYWDEVVEEVSELQLVKRRFANGTTIMASLEPHKSKKNTWHPDLGAMKRNILLESPTIQGRRERITHTFIGHQGELQHCLDTLGLWISGSKEGILKSWSTTGEYSFFTWADGSVRELTEEHISNLYRSIQQGAGIAGAERGHLAPWMQGWIRVNSEESERQRKTGHVIGALESRLTVLGLHELFVEIQLFLEDVKQMGKNNNDYDYWLFESSKSKVSKVQGILLTAGHHLIYDTQKSFYLGIQHAEMGFVRNIGSDHGIKPKLLSEAPVFFQATCGKNVTRLPIHENNCTSCQREKANIRNAEESARRKAQADIKVEVRASTDPLSGPVTTIVAPAEPIESYSLSSSFDPIKIQKAIDEFEQLADDHLTKAAEYQGLASKYRAILNPSDTLVAARQALIDAEREEERKKQEIFKDLQIALAGA